MKVEIVSKEKEIKKPTYPYLGISTRNNCVVLFTSFGAGTCLNAGSSYNTLGEYYEGWAENSFIPFEDKLVLQN